MNQWLRLTGRSGIPVWCNLARATEMRINDDDGALIAFGPEDITNVQESPDKIMQLLEGRR